MRSHVDMILFCSYLQIRPDDLDADFTDRIKKASDNELYNLWFEFSNRENKIGQLSFHETYHYYQGLTLPYLFWYSFICVRGIFDVFRELSQNESDFHNWGAKVEGFNNLSSLHKISEDKGNYYLQKTDKANNNVIDLTLLDLIESATSLAQFQILVDYNEKTDPVSFKRWTLRNSAYLKVYKFLTTVFEDEILVLRFLIPLINASFHTTQPMRAFVDLINNFLYFIATEKTTFKNFIEQKEACKWADLFEYIFLNYIKFEADPDSTADRVDPLYCKLNIENWINSSYGKIDETPISHPFINYHAAEWFRKSRTNLSYSSFMDYPGYMKGDFMQELSKEFFPTITFLKFNIDGVNDRVLTFGSLNYTHNFNFPIPIVDLLTIFSVVKRATEVQYIEGNRLCHHSECPEFHLNFCNSYPVIPNRFELCGFPNKVKKLINNLK